MKRQAAFEIRLIIAGLGGQGVVFLTRLLAQTAVSLGHPVMVSETHGMSQRGGSVMSHLKIGGNEAALIGRGTADAILALEQDEAIRNLPFLRQGGMVFVDGDGDLPSQVLEHLDRLNIGVLSIPACQMAVEMGYAAVSNVILAGFAAAHPTLAFPLETMLETVEAVARRGQLLNQEALRAGFQAGQAFITQ